MKKKINNNLTVEWNFDFSKQIKENFSNRQLADLIEFIISNNVLRKIDKGISPVNGVRMFEKYKNPKQYPGNLKASNKANLTLTGSMLSNYIAKPSIEPMTVTVGIHEDAPEIEKIKAKAHNYGTQKQSSSRPKSNRRGAKRSTDVKEKGIPARPFIPSNGRVFTKDIMLEIRKAFAYCLDQAINRGKNK